MLRKKIIRALVTGAMMATLFSLTGFAATKYISAPSGLNVRTSPAGTKVMALPFGTAVEALNEAYGWVQINYNDKIGYVSAEWLSENSPTSTVGTYLGTFTITGYCTCRKCCGKWSPEVTGKPACTASGTSPTLWRTIAVDPNVIPLGTWVEVNLPGIGWTKFRAEDTGSGVNGKHIDIYAGSEAHSFPRWCNGKAEVRLLY